MNKMAMVLCLIGMMLPVMADSGRPARMKPMLLVVDVQNHYLKYMDSHNREQALEMINGAMWVFRKHDFPVCRVYTVDPALGLKPGSEACNYPASIIEDKNDLVMQKKYYSAFKQTEMEKILRDNGCNTIFICGMNAVGCVMATYFGASERDITAFLVKGALMSHKQEYVGFAEDIMETVSFNTLKVMLDNIGN